MFRIGQKVACVGHASYADILARPDGLPVFGQVYTVTQSFIDVTGHRKISIAEIPIPETDIVHAGFLAKAFRPVVNTNTDISIFHRIADEAARTGRVTVDA